MFDKNYKNAMDNISPSADVKERILDKIELKEELKTHKNPATPWRIVFAAVACIAIVLGVVFAPKNQIAIKVEGNQKVLSAVKDYDEVYKIFRDQKIMARFNYFNNGIAVDDAEVVEEYYTQDDGVNLETAPSVDGATTKPTADANKGTSANKNYSETTEQVEGVSESDIVKTDGNYIYHLNTAQKCINVFSAKDKDSKLITKINLDSNTGDSYGEMFLKDNRLILLQTNSVGMGIFKDIVDTNSHNSNYISVLVYDVSDPANIKQTACTRQQGWYNTARMVGDYIYLISNCEIDVANVQKDKPETFVPTVICDDKTEVVPADCIYRYGDDKIEMPQYAVIGAYNYKDGALSDTASILGGTSQIYCSTNNIILTKAEYHDVYEENYLSSETTKVSRLEISNGKIEYKASGEIDGSIKNQFFIDEYKGYFRFVTTVTKTEEITQKFDNTSKEVISYSTKTAASLTVLDSELKKTGEIKDLAPDEQVYSVRFMGDIAYFVTFRQVDPLFSADLSDPKNPKIIGELKIPGFSQYMYPYGNGKLLGFGQDADENTGRTGGLKLSMFDITDPSNVTENDKTVIDNYNYSPALDNHKSMLVSIDKNLIGFMAYDNYGKLSYLVYGYNGEKFTQKAILKDFDKYCYDVRGLYINDGFYVITNNQFNVYDLKNFEMINSIEF